MPFRRFLCITILSLYFASPDSPLASEFYIATTGKPTNSGTFDQPLDLASVLSGNVGRPGDIFWLRGGLYPLGYCYVKLQGLPDNPITIRQYPGERATVDGYLFQEIGGWVTYWGFELMNSYPNRTSSQTGSFPTDIEVKHGFSGYAPGLKFINLILHDATANGIWLAPEATDAEIYGCLIYNNGWQGPDRGHGHGVYVKNSTGTKRILHNIIFNQYGSGIHIYGEGTDDLKNIQLIGNTSLNNGILSTIGSLGRNLLFGGDGGNVQVAGIIVDQNNSYNNPTYRTDGAIQIGREGLNGDVQVRNNYFAETLWIQNWHSMTVTGNTVTAPSLTINLTQTKEPLSASPTVWNSNTYFSPALQPFQYLSSAGTKRFTFADWKSATGLDLNSQYAAQPPTGVRSVVQLNAYDSNRANLIVYNWDKQSFVNLDLSAVIPLGAQYEIRNAQDYFAVPVATGTFDGGPLALPMSGLTVAKPIGKTTPPPPSGPEFNVFIILTSPSQTVNSKPVVSIQSPANGSVLNADADVLLAGTASDVEDGNLSTQLNWHSDVQGPLGAGAELLTRLAPGTHIITASVRDSDGASSSATSTVQMLQSLPALDVSVTTDKTTYTHRSRVAISVNTRSGTQAVPAADVSVRIIPTKGGSTTLTATSDSNGLAKLPYTVHTNRNGTGNYRVEVSASKAGFQNGTASTTFTVL